MNKPRLYFVHGTAYADKGKHLYKGVKAGFGEDLANLKDSADVIELMPDEYGEYRLLEEGNGLDYGECYLVATGNVAACGCKGQDGSIGVILSPVGSYKKYKENVQAIKELLELKLDYELDRKLMRLLYIGVCGEMEGYLSSTIIALVQGVREVFLLLRACEDSLRQPDEHKWRDALVKKLNDDYNFLSIKNRESDERKIYEKLLGAKLRISQELIDDMEWRNKMAHRVAFYSKPTYPSKEDVLSFIEQTDALVNYIDKKISQYKSHWLVDF